MVEALLYLMHPYLVPKLSIERGQKFLFILDFMNNSNVFCLIALSSHA
jgi:hypothetical protein